MVLVKLKCENKNCGKEKEADLFSFINNYPMLIKNFNLARLGIFLSDNGFHVFDGRMICGECKSKIKQIKKEKAEETEKALNDFLK